MIHSVKLLRWKSHEKTEIAFSKGTNVLVGPMGAGKTSVVDGLSFALYGTFPSLKSKKVTLEEIVMQRPEKYSEGKVEVAMEVAGKKYVIERTISGGGAKAFLMEGGKLIDTGPARVNEAVERLLKTDYELFARTIYADQNNIDAFLSLPSGERKRQIDELLGLDKFEKARSGAGTASNKLKAMKAEAERAMAGIDQAKLESELENSLREERELAAKLEEAKKQSKELELQGGFKKEKLAKLSQKQAEHSALSNEQAGQKEALKSVEESSTRIAAQLKKRVAEKEIESETRRIAAELSGQLELGKLISTLSPKNERLSAQIEANEKRKLELEKQTAGKTLGQIEAELSQAQAKLLQAKELETQLSQKHAQTTGALAFCQRAQKEKSELKQELTQVEPKLSEKTSLLQTVSLSELEGKANLLEASERANAARVIELGEAAQKLEAAHTQCFVCDSPLTQEKALELLAKKKKDLEAARMEVAKTVQERKTIVSQIEQAHALQAEVARLGEKKAELAKRLEIAFKEAGKATLLKEESDKLLAELASQKAQLLELVKLDGQLASAATSAHELGALEKVKLRLSAEKKKVSSELAGAKAKYSEEKRAALEVDARELEKSRELISLEAQAKKARERLSEVEQKISKLAFYPAELESVRTDLQETENKLTAAKVQSESGEKLLVEKSERAKELSQRVQAAANQANRLLKIDSTIATIAKFQNSVSQAQGYLRSELVEAVNEAAGILWKSIYPYADYQSVKLNAGETDYSVEILANTGEWVPAEHASGGERTCASLSLRIAFATVLTPHLSLLVLDEPTHNLDANAITSFCRTLREELPKIVEQTFIITHDEALKEGANAAVYKIERDKDRGDKSTVEKLSAN